MYFDQSVFLNQYFPKQVQFSELFLGGALLHQVFIASLPVGPMPTLSSTHDHAYHISQGALPGLDFFRGRLTFPRWGFSQLSCRVKDLFVSRCQP